ncbi:MAG: acetolactate synthase small subunit [Gammaproteobacteria bacterium AqS3]|nr:acetolactate synthase small subunit [Gammaproteobacteria bacterium AqS3]
MREGTRHVLAILLENEPGALSRVVGLFSQRGYNIDSLSVAPTHDETLSRLTVSTWGDERTVAQIVKHLNRLIDVVQVADLSEGDHLEREILLLKVGAVGGEQRAEIARTVSIFDGKIVDTHPEQYTLQISGRSDKLDAFIQALGSVSILEYVRSGIIGMSRSEEDILPG